MLVQAIQVRRILRSLTRFFAPSPANQLTMSGFFRGTLARPPTCRNSRSWWPRWNQAS